MSTRPEVTRIGFMDLQVCVPDDWSDELVEAFANSQQPTGIESPWRIRKEGHEALHGAPERVVCSTRDRYVHLMLEC